jgi:hypothetical protein
MVDQKPAIGQKILMQEICGISIDTDVMNDLKLKTRSPTATVPKCTAAVAYNASYKRLIKGNFDEITIDYN